MDEKQMQQLLIAMTQIAEIVTVYYNSLIKAGMKEPDAMNLTLDYQKALIFGSAEKKQGDNQIMKAFGFNN